MPGRPDLLEPPVHLAPSTGRRSTLRTSAMRPRPGQRRRPTWIVTGPVALGLVAAVALGLSSPNGTVTSPVTTLPTRSVQPLSPQPSSDQPNVSPTTSPVAGPSGPTQCGTPSGRNPTSGATATPPQVAPVVPGWQPVEGRGFVAFDVPPGWSIESPSAIAKLGNAGGPHEMVLMHYPATYNRGACDATSTTYRPKAGFVSRRGQTAGRPAEAILASRARVAGAHAGGSASPVDSRQVSAVRVAGASITADVATTVLTVTEPGDCPTPRMSITAVSFAVEGQIMVSMLYGDQGVPDALPQDVATQVITSLRPI